MRLPTLHARWVQRAREMWLPPSKTPRSSRSCTRHSKTPRILTGRRKWKYNGWLPPFTKSGNGRVNPLTGGYVAKLEPDPSNNNALTDLWYESWDEILLETLYHDNTRARNYAVFQCPSDSMPRDSTSGRPPRSYALAQSKWTWGLDDSQASEGGIGTQYAGKYQAA